MYIRYLYVCICNVDIYMCVCVSITSVCTCTTIWRINARLPIGISWTRLKPLPFAEIQRHSFQRPKLCSSTVGKPTNDLGVRNQRRGTPYLSQIWINLVGLAVKQVWRGTKRWQSMRGTFVILFKKVVFRMCSRAVYKQCYTYWQPNVDWLVNVAYSQWNELSSRAEKKSRLFSIFMVVLDKGSLRASGTNTQFVDTREQQKQVLTWTSRGAFCGFDKHSQISNIPISIDGASSHDISGWPFLFGMSILVDLLKGVGMVGW